MKIFSSLVLVVLFCSFSPITNSVDTDPPKAVAEIMNVDITYSADCSEFTWSVIICNNSKYGNSPATTVDIWVEYCPFTFDFQTMNVPSLAPRTCIRLSGTQENICGYACVIADLAGSNSMTECGGC